MCYPPTDFTMDGIVSEKPEETLKINWVYGYRGRDSQDNIFCLPSSTSLSLPLPYLYHLRLCYYQRYVKKDGLRRRLRVWSP